MDKHARSARIPHYPWCARLTDRPVRENLRPPTCLNGADTVGMAVRWTFAAPTIPSFQHAMESFNRTRRATVRSQILDENVRA